MRRNYVAPEPLETDSVGEAGATATGDRDHTPPPTAEADREAPEKFTEALETREVEKSRTSGETENLRSSDINKKLKPVFDRYAEEGGIPLSVLGERLQEVDDEGEIPERTRREILRRADVNSDGRMSYDEFVKLMRTTSRDAQGRPKKRFQTLLRAAVATVGDKPKRELERDEEDDDYLKEYSCCPPPVFMPIITIAEVAVFIFYVYDLKSRGTTVTAGSGVPFYSPLIWRSDRRYEVWRFFSYMFLHNGYFHLVFTLIFQLVLGLLLEVVHHFWRVGVLYLLGVFAGSLAHSVFDTVGLVGASGGSYALIGAHIANVIMNWEEMNYRWVKKKFLWILVSAPFRLTMLLILVFGDTGYAIYLRYSSGENKIGIAAHIGGLLSGLLLGIPILRNIDVKPWEKRLRIAAPIIYAAFVLFGIFWNVFSTGFPDTDWSKCCE